MKIILTVWKGRIAPVFDVAGRIVVVNRDSSGESYKSEYDLPESSGSVKLDFIKEMSPDVLVCGAVSRRFIHGIQEIAGDVFTFISGSVEEVLVALENRELQNGNYRMPGCGRGFCRKTGKGSGGAWIVKDGR